MSEHAVHEGHASHDEPLPFTEEEVAEFRSQDLAAGSYVVGLMLGIFALGVVLYAIVAISVAG